VLDSYVLNLSVRNGCFLMKTEGEKRLVHPSRVSSILVVMPCRMSSPAIILAATNEIPITICNASGKPEARLWSPRFMNIASLRRKQCEFCEQIESLNWIKSVISRKIAGQIQNLRFLSDRKPAIEQQATEAIGKMINNKDILDNLESRDTYSAKKQVLWLEASSAQYYWQTSGIRLPEPFTFTGRVKKNPTDGFNVCINYLYGIFKNQMETAILSMGLDPALGVLHRDGYKMPSLVFDLMEPFRPVADRMLFELILRGTPSDMIEKKEDSTCTITRSGRKVLIALFNEKLSSVVPFQGSNRLLKNQILSETSNLVRLIRKEPC